LNKNIGWFGLTVNAVLIRLSAYHFALAQKYNMFAQKRLGIVSEKEREPTPYDIALATYMAFPKDDVYIAGFVRGTKFVYEGILSKPKDLTNKLKYLPGTLLGYISIGLFEKNLIHAMAEEIQKKEIEDGKN